MGDNKVCFGGNGGMPGCTIGNPKYLGNHGGPSGYKSPPPWSNGWLVKTLFTSLGKSSCKFTNFVPLEVCSLDIIPPTILIGVDTNGALITVIID